MELYKKFYKGIFEGKKKNLQISKYSADDVLKEILSYIPRNDEGILEIQEIEFKTKEMKIVKRIILVNELHLVKEDSIPLDL